MSNQTNDDFILAENQYWIQMCKDLEGLEKDERFQRVILDGYFKDKAINQVSLLATDYIRRSGKRPEVMEELVAISALQDFFATIKNLGSPQIEEEVEDGIDEDEVGVY